MKKIYLFGLFMIFCITALEVGYSQTLTTSTAGTAILRTDQPYEMYGDKFLSSVINKSRVSKIIGHAKLVLKNDKITVTAQEIWYNSDDKKMQAYRKVVINKEDEINGKIVAIADTAEYYELKKKAILNGSPKIIQDKNEITGDKITIEFAETGAIIEIDGNVSGQIYPKPVAAKIEE